MSFHQAIRFLCVAAICCAVLQCNRTSAQDADYRISAVYSDKAGNTNEAGLGNRLIVQVSNASSLTALAKAQGEKIILFLNNIPVNGIYAETRNESTNANLLQFYLTRNDASKPAWASLLGHPGLLAALFGQTSDPDTGTGNKRVTVALGLEEDSTSRIITSNTGTIQLFVVNRAFLWVFVVLLVLVALGLFALAALGMLRDFGPKPPGLQKPFSLVQVQMAFWFLLGGGAFLFIWMITGVFDSLTTQVLTLMGLGCATALGTHIQNAQKTNPDADKVNDLFKQKDTLNDQTSSLAQTTLKVKLDNTLDELTRKTRLDDLEKQGKDLADQIKGLDKKLCDILPSSEGFLNDILTDADGISFHRFQMAAWTVLLGIIFVVEVWRSLAMPAFSDTLMALMGISSGTFVGFMMTEPHSSQMSS